MLPCVSNPRQGLYDPLFDFCLHCLPEGKLKKDVESLLCSDPCQEWGSDAGTTSRESPIIQALEPEDMLTLRIAHSTGLEQSAIFSVDSCISHVCGYFPNNELKSTRFSYSCLMEKSVSHYTMGFHDLQPLLGDTDSGRHRGIMLSICALLCNNLFAVG